MERIEGVEGLEGIIHEVDISREQLVCLLLDMAKAVAMGAPLHGQLDYSANAETGPDVAWTFARFAVLHDTPNERREVRVG